MSTSWRVCMSTVAKKVHDEVIVPVLRALAAVEPRMDSQAARRLLLGTAAHESGGFVHAWQITGPARSWWQVEPVTFDDQVAWLKNRPDSALYLVVDRIAIKALPWNQQYQANQFLACAIARIKYWRCTAALPGADDLDGLARYWKDNYNTRLGAGIPADFLHAWANYCAGAC